VARLLALARAARPGLRVALAAPTGKAAQRLAESIAAQAEDRAAPLERGGQRASVSERAGGSDAGPPAPAIDAQTLHRLLGATGDGRWARGPASPLAADLVVVDEASMVSLPLVDALLAALAPGARLVLLGDPDQLASVEAGAVFGDLCAAGAGDAGGDLAAFCDALGLAGVPHHDAAPALASAVVTLTESRRFTAESGIGAVARAVRAGDAPASRDAFGRFADVRLVGGDAPAEALAWALPRALAVATADTPEAALAALDRFRLLAATRRGPSGVDGLNAALDALLERETDGRLRAGRFARGRPVIVTANDYGAGLFNGDVGVAWTETGGDRVLCLPDPGRSGPAGGVRRVPFYRVPEHETAWALTVHKSQGSEADAVGLVLPPVGSPAAGRLTRELLYTAVTRARREAVVFGEAAVWDAGVRARTERASGLAERWTTGGGTYSSENDSPAR
jgi:exodeoxyribonuclease V alpha subunit